MAFDGCLIMMVIMSDGACCVLTTIIATAPVRVVSPELVATLTSAVGERPPTTAPAVLDPPPKSSSLPV
jgi:hypothetical protein